MKINFPPYPQLLTLPILLPEYSKIRFFTRKIATMIKFFYPGEIVSKQQGTKIEASA